jgi:hypothetical protein
MTLSVSDYGYSRNVTEESNKVDPTLTGTLYITENENDRLNKN